MSSSTSNFEAAAAADTSAKWRHWLAVFFATLAGLIGASYLLVLVIDPFSTGRFTPIKRVDVASRLPQYANAGRVRDPQFDSAIIGNSHAERLNPANIGSATGRSFVLLAVRGAHSSALITLTRAFDRHHARRSSAVVLVLDHFWCLADDPTDKAHPFPYWLYESSNWVYLRHVLFPRAMEAAAVRIAILLGIVARADAANGYSAQSDARGNFITAEKLARMSRPSRAAIDAPFPALEGLQQLVREIDPQTRILLFFPPVHISAIPEPGSAAEQRFNVCKARIRNLAASRPNTAYLDMRTESSISKDVEDFFDPTHYRERIARIVEQEIAAALGPLLARQ